MPGAINRPGLSRLACEVVIPVRWHGPPAEECDDFRCYLDELVRWCDITVVDGSTDPGVEDRWATWSPSVRILRPAARWAGANGKVVGSMTGLEAARHEQVVIADDDVRYTREALTALVRALDGADLVVPQNHPTRWTWWVWWEAGRVLLNRAVSTDWPGTAALRRSTALAMGGWCPDVLFENLEMARTVEAFGGVVCHRPDLLVARHPPTMQHFVAQRLRQAYEDQAVPARLAAQLSVLPALLALGRRPHRLGAAVLGLVALAELGRRRDGAAAHFHPAAPLAAPVWLVERGLLSWAALVARARGGLPYHGRRIRLPAHSVAQLRTRVVR